jgi:hypothetical protein
MLLSVADRLRSGHQSAGIMTAPVFPLSPCSVTKTNEAGAIRHPSDHGRVMKVPDYRCQHRQARAERNKAVGSLVAEVPQRGFPLQMTRDRKYWPKEPFVISKQPTDEKPRLMEITGRGFL